MIQRRDVLLAAAAASLASAVPLGRVAAQQGLTQEGLLRFDPLGQVTLLHLTDLHAQLMPMRFREPSRNIGVGEARGRPPHVTGAAFRRAFDIPAGSPEAHALTDEDRAPWLRAVAAWIEARRQAGEPGVITCSALRRSYRDAIAGGHPGVRVVYLKADRALIAERLGRRQHHYMPATLLESQLATLEEPSPDEHVLTVMVHGSVEDIAAEVVAKLQAGM